MLPSSDDHLVTDRRQFRDDCEATIRLKHARTRARAIHRHKGVAVHQAVNEAAYNG